MENDDIAADLANFLDTSWYYAKEVLEYLRSLGYEIVKKEPTDVE